MADDEIVKTACWQFNEAVSLLREAREHVAPGTNLLAEIDDGLPAIQEALRSLAEWVAAGPQATPGQEPVCGGFVWIGQPMTSCDRCGQPAWEHEGLDQPPADPFSDAPSTVRPWKPGEAEAIRAKWGGSSTVHVAEVRRPIPGARDMTGNAVPTDHEDRP